MLCKGGLIIKVVKMEPSKSRQEEFDEDIHKRFTFMGSAKV